MKWGINIYTHTCSTILYVCIDEYTILIWINVIVLMSTRSTYYNVFFDAVDYAPLMLKYTKVSDNNKIGLL